MGVTNFLKYYHEVKSGYSGLECNSVTYSIDMVRLNFCSGEQSQALSDYISRLMSLGDYIEIKYYPNYSPFKYRHLWSFEDSNGSCWSMGLSLGSEKDKGYIEFNPNKCMNSDIFVRFWDELRFFTITRQIVRWDLAIDIPVSRCLCVLKKDRRQYQSIIKDASKTEYLGQRSHKGFVKLYDKTAESKLDYDLTRLEITLPRENFNLSDYWPEIYIMQSQCCIDDNLGLDSCNLVLVQLLRDCDNPNYYMKQLNPRRRKKIEPYLATDTVLGVDIVAFQELLCLLSSFE